MTATLSQLGTEVLERLEENTSSPQFWTLAEIYDLLVEAAREATLISGEPQFRTPSATPYVPAINQTLQTPPPDCVAILRIQSASEVLKTTLWELDRSFPDWESASGDLPQYWFPFGLGQFGLYPKLPAAVKTYLSYIKCPVYFPRPYTGNEVIDFQQEYLDAIVAQAAHLAAFKEATNEFMSSLRQHDEFAARMQQLTKFSVKKGALRFTRSKGFPARVSPVVTA